MANLQAPSGHPAALSNPVFWAAHRASLLLGLGLSLFWPFGFVRKIRAIRDLTSI